MYFDKKVENVRKILIMSIFCLKENLAGIHIGMQIQQKCKEKGITISYFARELNCDRSNVYDIFKRQSGCRHVKSDIKNIGF